LLFGVTLYALAHLLRRQRGEQLVVLGRDAAPTDGGGAAGVEPEPFTERLARVRTALEGAFQPSDALDIFLQRPDVAESVREMSALPWTADELFETYSGGHALLSWAALSALAARPDGVTLADRVRDTMSRYHPWTRELALRLLDVHVPPPASLVGPLLASIDENWEHDDGIAMLGNLVRSRVARGEELSWSGALDSANRTRLDLCARYVDRLGEVVTPLKEALRVVRAGHIDDEFLQSFGRIWGRDAAASAPVVEHAALAREADAIQRALTAEPPRSVVLVGDPGVGRTTLARVTLARLQQSGWTVFEAAPEELNADQKFVGSLEGRVQQLVREIDRRKRVVWFVRDVPALAWTGTTMQSTTSALDMLLPPIERGEIVVLGTAEPAMYERMLLAKPRVRSVVEERRIAPLDRGATIAVVSAWLAAEAARGAAPPAEDALLHEAWNLARQYLGEPAPPGNLFRLVQAALRGRTAGTPDASPAPLRQDELIAALSMMTGLPPVLLDERERLDLTALRRHFEERVIGQPEATDCLVERLAMVKAGVTDPGRPLGVFLFAGPTGTGKTEVAKSLASFVFGDAARMIRLDMTELAHDGAIGRIVGEPVPDGAHVALVDRIRAQPFSVVLLDEFEKAHPAIWDLFLQVFDDGRLTDRRGRTADFRHAIVIMTSNLGGQIPAGTTLGFSDESGRFSSGAVERAVARAFRREFLNRIDRVIVFRPLTRDTMRLVLKKQLRESFTRRGLRNRQWAVEWDEAALEFLLERGFTVDLGARPLQRAIERYVLAPLARTIVDHEVPRGDQFLFVHREGDALSVEFVDPDRGTEPAADAVEPRAALSPGGADLDALGARAEALGHRVRGAAWRAAQHGELELTGLDSFWSSPERFAILDRIEYRDRIEHALQSTESLLGRLRGDGAVRRRGPVPQLERLSDRLRLLETACADAEQQRPHDAFVLVEATSDAGRRPPQKARAFAHQLAGMYIPWSERQGMRLVELERAAGPTGGVRVVLSVSGLGAHSLLASEDGWHMYETPSGAGHDFDRWPTRVRVEPQPPEPPHAAGIDLAEQARRAMAARPSVTGTIVRHYRESPSPLVRDHVRGYRTGRLDLVLAGEFDRLAAP
jgi:ATP-dependent Clp protease ATP-binding subunit ClpC